MTDDSLNMKNFPISELHYPHTRITVVNLIPSEWLSQLNLSQSFSKMMVVKHDVRFIQYCTWLLFKVLAPQPLTSSLFWRPFRKLLYRYELPQKITLYNVPQLWRLNLFPIHRTCKNEIFRCHLSFFFCNSS